MSAPLSEPADAGIGRDSTVPRAGRTKPKTIDGSLSSEVRGAPLPPPRGKAARKRRRADGSLRPTVRRRRARKNAERNATTRAAWLAQFAPGDRERFFNHVVVKDAVFLAGLQKATGFERADAAALLERTANERRWRKLRTLDGTVVGIAPPRSAATSLAGSTSSRSWRSHGC